MNNPVLNALYDCLAFNHNFHNFVKQHDAMWARWCQELAAEIPYIPKLCEAISAGQLETILTNKRAIQPTIQDIKRILEPIKRLNRLDESGNQLAYKPKRTLTPDQVHAMLEKARAKLTRAA